MAGYPATTNGGIANNYQTNLGQTQNWNQGDVRIDHQITPNDNFFGRWSFQKTETIAPYTFPAVKLEGLPKAVGLGNEDTFAGPASNPVQHAVISYTKVISPRMVNDARIGFNRFVLDYTQADAAPGDNLGNLLGIRNANSHPLQYVLPIINHNNYAGVGHSRSLPIYRRSNTFHYQDNVTYSTGAHTLKFGGAATAVRSPSIRPIAVTAATTSAALSPIRAARFRALRATRWPASCSATRRSSSRTTRSPGPASG